MKRFIICPKCGSDDIEDLPENEHWEHCKNCDEEWFKHLC